MEIKRGTRIGLNKSIRAFYFQGDNGINLRSGINDTTIIPDDISDRNLEMIKKSVLSGQLVVGWAEEPKPDVKYKEDDLKLLEKGVKKMDPFLEEIAKFRGTGDESSVARLEKLLTAEKSSRNRKTVVEKIEKLLGGISGVSAVVEDAAKEEIKIDIVR